MLPRMLTEKYQIPRFLDVERLIDAVDVIDVIAPTPQHFNLAKLAIRKGKHVFLEKPMANTMQEAQELVNLVQNHCMSCW